MAVYFKSAISASVLLAFGIFAQFTESQSDQPGSEPMLPTTMFGLILLTSFCAGLGAAWKEEADSRIAAAKALHACVLSLAIGMGLYYVSPDGQKTAFGIICVTTLIAWFGEKAQAFIWKLVTSFASGFVKNLTDTFGKKDDRSN